MCRVVSCVVGRGCFIWQVHSLDKTLLVFALLHFVFQVQISSVQLLSHVRLFVTPWTAAYQASLSITNSQNVPKLMSIESVMRSTHLILCHPLLLLPSIFPSIRVFSNESALHIRWPCIGVSASAYSKAKLACYFRYLLTFYFCIPITYDEKDIFFLVLVLEGLVGLHRTFVSTKNTKKWLW